MDFASFFSKPEELLAIDIGSGGLKIADISASGSEVSLNSFAYQPLEPDLLNGNLIAKPEQLAEIIEKTCEAHDFYDKRVIFSVPAPAVFTKRIKMQKQSDDELRSAVQFEAANFIPHKIDAVKLDYAVLGEASKNQLDLLVIAVKSELLQNYESCLAMAGLESAVADVDFFALHNLLQFNYQDLAANDKAVAVLSFGYRFSSLSISKNGLPVFVGDISIGVKNLEEDLAIKLSLSEPEVKKKLQEGALGEDWLQHVNAFNEQTSQELNRQLSFFWNTCGIEGVVSGIYLTGGGAFIPGLQQALERKSSSEVIILDNLAKFTIDGSIDNEYLKKCAPMMSVALGLGLRGSVIK